MICALGLLVHAGKLRQFDAAFRYFSLNVFGTLLLLIAVVLIYGATGKLRFAAISSALATLPPAFAAPLLGLLALAFLIKSAAFPFFAWLPASYLALPAPVMALFSALLTKLGIYALIRTLSDYFYPASAPLFDWIGWIGLASMVSGVLGAAYHWDIRQILVFHSISQIGYMLLAMALASRAGDAATIYFMLHHSLVKAGLILTGGLIFQATGHYDLRRMGGLLDAHPWLAFIFLVLACSLIGIPPSSGFWGKYLIVREALAQKAYFSAMVALGVGGLTLYSMAKIWIQAFWKPYPDHEWRPARPRNSIPALATVGILTLLTLWMGVFPEKIFDYLSTAVAGMHGEKP